MNQLDPIKQDFQVLARVLVQGRPSCPLARAEQIAGVLITELGDTNQAPHPEKLASALFRTRKDPAEKWLAAVEDWIPHIRPAFSYHDRERTVGERYATSSALATVAAHIAMDQDVEYLAKVWADLPDEARDKIVRLAREATV